MSEKCQKDISLLKKPVKSVLGGFTLIELLVVVLIIGILAAIALPKYQVAVGRARVARALPLLRSIVEAQERYYMANGVYTADLDALDLQIAYASRIESDNQSWQYQNTPIGHLSVAFSFPCAYWDNQEDKVAIDFCGGNMDRKMCYAQKDSPYGDRLCASLGRKTASVSDWGTSLYSLNF